MWTHHNSRIKWSVGCGDNQVLTPLVSVPYWASEAESCWYVQRRVAWSPGTALSSPTFQHSPASGKVNPVWRKNGRAQVNYKTMFINSIYPDFGLKLGTSLSNWFNLVSSLDKRYMKSHTKDNVVQIVIVTSIIYDIGWRWFSSADLMSKLKQGNTINEDSVQ